MANFYKNNISADCFTELKFAGLTGSQTLTFKKFTGKSGSQT